VLDRHHSRVEEVLLQNEALLKKEGKGEKEDEEEKKEKKDSKILLGTARIAMMVRSASLTYSQTNGTLLPGIVTNPVTFGMDPSSLFAPGIDFVFGAQSDGSRTSCGEQLADEKHETAQSIPKNIHGKSQFSSGRRALEGYTASNHSHTRCGFKQ
jgi:cell surface protein SprA